MKPRVVFAFLLLSMVAGATVWRLWGRGDGPAIARMTAPGFPIAEFPPDLHPEYRAMLAEAKTVVLDLAREYPADPRTPAAAAGLNNLAHDADAEIACWKRCLELDPHYLAAYSRWGTYLIDKGDYSQAESVLRQALKVPRVSPDFTDLLASALMSQGKLDEAARLLEGRFAQFPPDAQSHVQLGEVYLQLKQAAEAKEQFSKAAALDSASTRAWHGLSQAATRLGDHEEAERCRSELQRLKAAEEAAVKSDLEKGVTRVDREVVPACVADIHFLASQIYWENQRPDTSEEHLQRAIELAPEASRLQALARLYSDLGRLEASLAVVAQLRQLEPQNPNHLRTYGLLQARLNQTEAAEQTFLELCQQAPDWAVGYAGLAELHLRSSKDLNEAKSLAAKAVELEPSGWNYFILAAICERLGDLPGARTALETAIKLEPHQPRYREMYALIQGKG